MGACAEERQQLYENIQAFAPANEQEAVDKEVILRALRDVPNVFDRSAQAHMACSIWVVDPTFSQTLMVYHNIYDSWPWIGGHADRQRYRGDLRQAQLKRGTCRIDSPMGRCDRVE